MTMGVDLGTVGTWVGAVIALVPALTAFQRTWPGFTADDRRRRRILSDLRLMRALPKGSVRDDLSAAILESTSDMLRERRRDKRIEQAWTGGSIGWFVTWVLLVLLSAVPSGATWAAVVKPSLSVFVLIALAFSLVCFGAIVVLAVRQGRRWLKARSSAPVDEGALAGSLEEHPDVMAVGTSPPTMGDDAVL